MLRRPIHTLFALIVLAALLAGCTTPTPTFSPGPTPLPSQEPPDVATPTLIPAPTATFPTGQVGAASIGDPQTPGLGNTGYDVQKYVLALRIDPLSETLSGTVTLEAVATLNQLARFSLDFVGDYVIHDLRLNGRAVDYQWQDEKLFVNPAQPLALGTPLTIAVHYSGSPRPIRSRYLPFIPIGLTFKDGAAYVVAEPDGARAWFPANDHPRDKARFRFEITVPRPYVVAANGQPEPPIDPPALASGARDGDGWLTYVWDSDMLMATYLATVAIDEYTVIEQTAPNGLPLRHFVPPEIVDEAAEKLAITGEMVLFLEEYFGPYPFESYGHALTSVQGVAMETQTMTILPVSLISSDNNRTLVHELAHQWFGNSVSPASWDDVWLNEGFASYGAWLWLQARAPEASKSQRENIENNALAINTDDPLADPAPQRMFSFNSYRKGPWVLHMLRQQLGDAVFFRLLQTYHRRFQGSVASTADFQQVAEEVSGQDLDQFFDQWIYGPGLPELALYWRQANGRVEVQLCQRQDRPFVLPLTLDLAGDGASQTFTISLDERAETVHITVPFTVTALIPDPGQHLLAPTTTERRDELPSCP